MKLQGGVKLNIRRKRVLSALELQLKKGTKNVPEWSGRDPHSVQRPYPLTPSDILRIEKEINILKQRVR